MEPPPILRDIPTSFDTKRLTLRCPAPGDGAEVNAAIRETWDDLAEWMPWAIRRPAIEETEEFVRRAQVKYLEREELTLFLFLKGTTTFVGGCSLHRIDWKVPSFDLGYWCRRSMQRNGYVTEATDALADFAVRELGARRLTIRCDGENARSAAIPRRIGFALESRQRNARRHHLTGELRDTLVFARVIPDVPAAGR